MLSLGTYATPVDTRSGATLSNGPGGVPQPMIPTPGLLQNSFPIYGTYQEAVDAMRLNVPNAPIETQPYYVGFEPIGPAANNVDQPDLNKEPDINIGSQNTVQTPTVDTPYGAEANMVTGDNPTAAANSPNLLGIGIMVIGMLLLAKGRII